MLALAAVQVVEPLLLGLYNPTSEAILSTSSGDENAAGLWRI